MKTVIITGASKGIGKALAELCIKAGQRVINVSRTSCPLPEVINIPVDLLSPSLTSQLKLKLEEILTLTDGETQDIALIHNAALMQNDSSVSTDETDFRKVMEVNLMAPHIINQILIPHMSTGSSIIYVGSTLAEKSVPNAYSYVVSKHAQVGMMRSCCQDLAGSGIHTACICPGFTDTEMLRTHVGEDKATLEAIGALSTFGRLIEPEEIAQALYFAIHHPVINGAVIHANLGQVES